MQHGFSELLDHTSAKSVQFIACMRADHDVCEKFASPLLILLECENPTPFLNSAQVGRVRGGHIRTALDHHCSSSSSGSVNVNDRRRSSFRCSSFECFGVRHCSAMHRCKCAG